MKNSDIHDTAARLFLAAKTLRKADKPAEIARLLGVTEQRLTNWSRRGVSKEGMLIAQRQIGCSATWIETGDGRMTDRPVYHNSADANRSKKDHSLRLIKESPTSAGDRVAGEALVDDGANVFGGNEGLRKIPVISYVQAGMMTEAMDPFALGEGFELVTTDLDLSPGAFALVIKGESMLPEFREGEKIIVDPAVQPMPGDYVVAKNSEEEATFKKYRARGTGAHGEMVFELVPLNDDFPILRSDIDHLRIVGVMVEHRRYRRR